MSEYPFPPDPVAVARIRDNLDRWRARCVSFRAELEERRLQLAVHERRVRVLGAKLQLFRHRVDAPIETVNHVQATRDAVVDLLRRSARPMHFRTEIHPALAALPLHLAGPDLDPDPAATLLSRIAGDPRLLEIRPGVFALREDVDPPR